MTDDAKRMDTDELWADDELSDDALDRAAGRTGKACISPGSPTHHLCALTRR